jgi:tetratricopeptide (TPR) repeat protein
MIGVAIAIACAMAASQAQPPAPGSAQAAAIEKDGRDLLARGSIDAAVERLRAAVRADPQRFEANEALGLALDLQGTYVDARAALQRALTLAPERQRTNILAEIGTSFAFERRPEQAARFYRRAFDAQIAARDAAAAAATANALGRAYLESGNVEKAEQWYRTGYETSRRISHSPAAQLALWDMRWEHAQGRIAARRGRRAVALQHAAAVKRLLDRGVDANQQAAYPYLLGYIDFSTRHYRDALTALKQADQNDVFILGLIGQTYAKVGDRTHAREYFERVLAASSHNLNMAFARPIARRYLRR